MHQILTCHFLLTTEPLRIKEVKVSKRGVLIMKQKSVFVKKFRGLIEFGSVAKAESELGHQLAVHGGLVLFVIQYRVVTLNTQFCRKLTGQVFESKIRGWNFLLQEFGRAPCNYPLQNNIH